nr:hypothetical protein [Tanacetum cinerariifolium]
MMMRTKIKNPPLDQTGGPRDEEKERSQKEPMQTTHETEEPLHPEFEIGAADDQPIAETSQHPEWFSQQKKPPTPNHDWNKTLPATHGSIQPWISELAKQTDSRSSFNELLDTPMEFSAFLMNRLKVDTLTPKLLARPTYELMKGSCKSLVELEFFLEEVYKATTDQLDLINPEGQQYPHNLLKPLPLIPNSRGRRVIPFDQSTTTSSIYVEVPQVAKESMHTTHETEEPSHPEFEIGVADDQPIAETSQHPEWFSQQKKPPSPNHDWNKTLPATHGSIQPWISELAKQTDSRSSFNELLDTPMEFSAFLMNRLKVDTLTPELLARPTYELMKGSCKSLVELEFFLEEVYKATTDQLDLINPEGQQYPHNLLKPLPLIPNSRGRRVIPFDQSTTTSSIYVEVPQVAIKRNDQANRCQLTKALIGHFRI